MRVFFFLLNNNKQNLVFSPALYSACFWMIEYIIEESKSKTITAHIVTSHQWLQVAIMFSVLGGMVWISLWMCGIMQDCFPLYILRYIEWDMGKKRNRLLLCLSANAWKLNIHSLPASLISWLCFWVPLASAVLFASLVNWRRKIRPLLRHWVTTSDFDSPGILLTSLDYLRTLILNKADVVQLENWN